MHIALPDILRETNQILELSSGLLNHTILSLENDTHSGQISDLGLTHDERVYLSATRPYLLLNSVGRDLPMLKPLPARIPETLDKTPGSFCTKQFNRCLEGLDQHDALYPPLVQALGDGER